jgi:hypothetical protein
MVDVDVRLDLVLNIFIVAPSLIPNRLSHHSHRQVQGSGLSLGLRSLTPHIHDGSSRNRAVAKRDGRAEP